MVPHKIDALKYLVFAIIVCIFPSLVNDEYIISTFAFTGIFAIVMLGQVLLIGYSDLLSLGHGAFFGIGVDVVGILTVKAGFPPVAAIPIGKDKANAYR